MRLALFTLVSIAVGCSSTTQNPPANASPTQSHVIAELTDRDADLVRYLLRERDDPADDKRIYFLTTTPMDDWGEMGTWAELPAAFHQSIADLKTKYRPASGAYL